MIARLMAPELQFLWGQPVIIENRPGANAIVATEAAARAAPDGHTLLLAAGNHTTNPAVYARLPYDTERDFAPVAVAALAPTVLLVNPATPYRTVAELVAAAKARPGAIGYATSGTGGVGHFAGEMLKQAAGVDLPHVAYRGTAPALQDLVSGVVPVSFATLSTALPLIRDNRLRPVAIATASRLPMLPGVPSFVEAGYAGFEATSVWYGLMAPAGLSPDLVRRLADDAAAVLRKPELREKFEAQACIPGDEGPAAFSERIRRELPLWEDLARASSIRVD
ncbi:tripartite tricarboxylate transporter substrate-binding protein [Roseomonas populi]|uniref:Tripartite tricarboxylate transporter substrate-binding protein n=1 Tax=Roseomonas populi TaxID=3121582 RepID=A0ABT1XCG7_9PROT|nr:tripartite tricarboxylate transporter substrate-binding protein [Roseomonas pecuniae]MCR0985826.1 tripartite tricarboxylate transporter substrate-binding protein [Roseomonas pecuniae]